MAAPSAFDQDAAERYLARRDRRLAELIAHTARFQIEPRRSPYEALLESITHQSISTKAAGTIFQRVKALGSNGSPPTAQAMLRLRTLVLRRAGLSGAKTVAMKDLARKTLTGVVPTLAQARRLNDEELIERLVSVRGIGRWSVEMFLIFRLGRPDVLPVDDLGVRKGWMLAYRRKSMPTAHELREFAERWRPYRTLGTWYMWRALERHRSSDDATERARGRSRRVLRKTASARRHRPSP